MAGHQVVLMWSICLAITLFFVLEIIQTRRNWTILVPRKYEVGRIEKSCEAMFALCALLIPATIGLLTWLRDKAGPGSYTIPLCFALVYFVAMIIFTAHIRFNFLWRFDTEFGVSSQKNMRFAYWLTCATGGIVFGLILVSIPVLELGFGWLKMKETQLPSTPVNVICTYKPADVVPPPQPTPCKRVSHHRHKPRWCPCTPSS